MITSLSKAQRACVSLRNPIDCLALGFGSGLLPISPGTFGSFAGLPLVFLQAYLPVWGQVLWLLLASLAGIYICQYTAKRLAVHDHPAIVWDEVVGIGITFIAVPLSIDTLLVGMALFRLFDIWKPWLIGCVDRYYDGGLGIMLDDILAGCAACLGVHLYLQWLS